MTAALRVLIVDDHLEFRQGLQALLRTDADVETVGVAQDGTQAIELASRLQPDVVLMDLHMPHLNGVEATRAIVTASPHIRVLVLTMFDADDSVMAALRAGARGYLLKGAGREDMLRAIRSVANGDLILGPAVATRLLNTLVERPQNDESFPELSIREREILDLIADGVNNTAISEQLFLSPKTVRNHITNIFAKLHVADRAQAIVLARQRSAGQPESWVPRTGS
jgi:DNA-binding NarL/FixJ family response regulator